MENGGIIKFVVPQKMVFKHPINDVFKVLVIDSLIKVTLTNSSIYGYEYFGMNEEKSGIKICHPKKKMFFEHLINDIFKVLVIELISESYTY